MWYSMRNAHNFVYLLDSSSKFKSLFQDDPRLICAFFGVNRATAYRWIEAGAPTSKTALRLLDIAASGFLPCLEQWDGFFIWSGRLITPSGFDLLPAEIDALAQLHGRSPSAPTVLRNTRNGRPWRDREPDFVKTLKAAHR